MDPARRKQIVAAIEEKKATAPCPRCGALSFSVAGEASLPLQEPDKGYVLGGPVVPVAMIVCTNCGYVSLHALFSLGLMWNQESPNG